MAAADPPSRCRPLQASHTPPGISASGAACDKAWMLQPRSQDYMNESSTSYESSGRLVLLWMV
jgi:hypothetical protein